MLRSLFFSPCLIFPCLIMCNFAVAENIDTKSQLRTLFTSSHLRNELDLQRAQGKFSNTTKKSTNTILREPVTVKLQGVVLRKNKKPVVFINNANTLKSSTVSKDIRVNAKSVNKKGYKVPVRVNQQRLNIKPGQQWNETDPHVRDNYQMKPTKAKTGDSDKNLHEANNSSITSP